MIENICNISDLKSFTCGCCEFVYEDAGCSGLTVFVSFTSFTSVLQAYPTWTKSSLKHPSDDMQIDEAEANLFSW